MSPAQKVIQCGICGHKMVIPPGFENAVGRCTICGGTVSANQSPPASRFDETIRSAKPKAEPKWSDRLKEIRAAVLHGLVGGLIGAFIGGAIMAAFMFIRKQLGGTMTVGAFFSSADPGLLAGFVICSSWAVIRRLSLGPFMGLLIGSSVGVAMGLLTYGLEAEFVAPSEMPIWAAAMISGMGGGVVGFIIGGKVGSPD